MNTARISQVPFWGLSEAFLFLIKRLVSLPTRLAFKFELTWSRVGNLRFKGLNPIMRGGLPRVKGAMQLSFYKILFHFNALLGESIIHTMPPTHLQSLPDCITIARSLCNIRPPTDPSFVWHNHALLVIAISCKGQPAATK